MIFFHSTLSLHNFLHPLIPIICKSSSMSSIHLYLGLPLFLLPVCFHSNTLLCILFFLPSPSRDPVKPFFCFLQSSVYLRFLLSRSFRNSFCFSRIHLHFALDQRFFSIFIYIYSNNIPPIIIINRIYENQNHLSL